MLIVTKRTERASGKDFIRCIAHPIDTFTAIDCWGNEIIAEGKSGSRALLGRYETNERAVEVFDEIIALFGKYYHIQGGPLITQEGYVQPAYFEPPKVYTMPEK